jgi:Zn-dependent peptidase ImmA (M78 family)
MRKHPIDRLGPLSHTNESAKTKARNEETDAAPASLRRHYQEITGKASALNGIFQSACRAVKELEKSGAAVPAELQRLVDDLGSHMPSPAAAFDSLKKMASALTQAGTPLPATSIAFRERGVLSPEDRHILDRHAAALSQSAGRGIKVPLSPAGKLAEVIRNQFDLGYVPDLEFLCSRLNVDVEEVPVTGFEGALLQSEARGTSKILLKRGLRSEGRKRFTIAHELGHLLFEASSDFRHGCQPVAMLPSLASPDREAQANEFAAELLMPQRCLARMIDQTGPTLANVQEIATYFRTSLTSAALRYQRVCGFQCAVVHSEGSAIQWEFTARHERKFPFELVCRNDLKNLPEGSVIRRLREGALVPEGMHEVPPETWLAPTDAARVVRLYEDSRFFPRYDTGLTLLWVPGHASTQ